MTPAILGIETVYQDLALCDNLDVVANLFIGSGIRAGELSGRPHERGRDGGARSPWCSRPCTFEFPSIRAKVGGLSGGQRQSIAVGRSVLWGSRIALLDEPTAALGVVQQREVLDLVLRLKRPRLGVVLISHNLQQVFEVVDRLVVLRLGRVAANVMRDTVSPQDIVGYITGTQQAP